MESTRRNLRLSQQIIRWSVIFLFLAFAWEYWRWGGPIRNLLWDEDLFKPIANSLGWQWSEWVSSLQVEAWIKSSSILISLLFLLSAITTLFFPTSYRKVALVVIGTAVTILLFQTLLKTKSHFWQLGYFFEHSLQWISPILFIFLMDKNGRSHYFERFARVTIAATFIGHGLFALGYYPIPGHFVDMVINGVGFSNAQAILSLKCVGILDIIAAILLLLPFQPYRNYALKYIIIWGFLTAIARLWSYAPFYSTSQLAGQWLSESAWRWVHFLVPLALLYFTKNSKKIN